MGSYSWTFASCKAWRLCLCFWNATDKEGNIIGAANPYAQTIQVIKNIQTALQAVGASLQDIVRTRMYVTDINNWKKVGEAHAKFFKQIRPASTLVEVSRLINPEILVEMEVDAIVNTAQDET